MTLLRIIMHAVLNVSYGVRSITGTGPFGHRRATYVHGLARSCPNGLKAALFRHHVKQFNEASCSVATVASVINALRERQGCKSAPVRQDELLEAVTTGHWKERMQPAGHNGRRGLPLTLLGEVVESSLTVYRVGHRSVETVRAEKKAGTAAAVMANLKQQLGAFDGKGTCLIIAHFDQGAYVKTLNIPHISPVGGFDADKETVTILDVDPDQPRPYRVGFDTFYKGLASDYHHIFKPFGYGRGGYVLITL